MFDYFELTSFALIWIIVSLWWELEGSKREHLSGLGGEQRELLKKEKLSSVYIHNSLFMSTGKRQKGQSSISNLHFKLSSNVKRKKTNIDLSRPPRLFPREKLSGKWSGRWDCAANNHKLKEHITASQPMFEGI